jgi:hypothetical protein
LRCDVRNLGSKWPILLSFVYKIASKVRCSDETLHMYVHLFGDSKMVAEASLYT